MGKKIEGFDVGVSVSAWWLVSAPVDFRCGADRLLVHVREALGRDPLDGSAYVFCNRRTSRIKVLVVDRQGVWLLLRRLHQGGFVCAGLIPSDTSIGDHFPNEDKRYEPIRTPHL